MHLICGLIPKKLLNHEVCEQYDTDKPLGMEHSAGSNLTETIMQGTTYHSKNTLDITAVEWVEGGNGKLILTSAGR